MKRFIINPKTGRQIKPGKAVYNRLIEEGYVYNNETHTLELYASQPITLLDADVPDIGVEPLKPTPFQEFKNKVVANAGKMANWLWKIFENKKKNANKLADWIINLRDEIVNKVLPPKVAALIGLSRNFKYNHNGQFWKINLPSNPDIDEALLRKEVEANRNKYGKEYNNKFLKMYYFNNIKSFDDINEALNETYRKESNAFKLLISFGYITEKHEEDRYKIKLYQPSQDYFNDKPELVRNKKDIEKLKKKMDAGRIIRKLTERFPDTKTRMIGVYSMAVKVIRLDYPIGSKTQLPKYIKTSKFIVSLEDVEYNLCFWACLALAEGVRIDRCIRKSKELFALFYRNGKVLGYEGFDYVNELDKYEQFNEKYAINIVSYDEDQSIEYVRKSEFNEVRIKIYLNLYLDHFSYITNLEKLAKMYVCNRCGAKFDNNFNLERHINTCNLEQEDTFVTYPEIYEKKRNDIVELCDWFNISGSNLYKYDYLITFD